VREIAAPCQAGSIGFAYADAPVRPAVSILVLVAWLAVAPPARADRIAWTPLRLGLTTGIDVPTNSNFILSDLRIDIAQQVGGAAVAAHSKHGNGPFASLGGAFGLGLYTPIGGAMGCEDEVDPEDGSSRWTCGRLTLGGSVTVGWSWGALLKSGYMLPQRSIYVQLTPYLAAVKNPERSGAELDVTATLGYWWSWGGIGARWSRIPGNDYYGVALQLTKGFTEWLANDELVEPEPERTSSADPLPPMRVELGFGAMFPVHRANDGAKGIATIHLGAYKRSSSDLEGPFTGIGGVASFLLADSSGFHIGPAVTVGSRTGALGLYARGRGLVGARTLNDESRFDYGGEVALGLSVGVPEEDLDDVGDGSLGFEATASWIAGDVFVGGMFQLLLF
jgi:hypothetical protein